MNWLRTDWTRTPTKKNSFLKTSQEIKKHEQNITSEYVCLINFHSTSWKQWLLYSIYLKISFIFWSVYLIVAFPLHLILSKSLDAPAFSVSLPPPHGFSWKEWRLEWSYSTRSCLSHERSCCRCSSESLPALSALCNTWNQRHIMNLIPAWGLEQWWQQWKGGHNICVTLFMFPGLR